MFSFVLHVPWSYGATAGRRHSHDSYPTAEYSTTMQKDK